MKLKRKELLLIISVCFIYWGAMILGIRWFKNYASRIELSEELQIELEEDKAGAVILLQDIRRIPGGIGQGVGVDLIPADVGIVQCGRGFHAGGRREFGHAYACAQ